MIDRPIRVVHYLNQFFAGIGGEDKADVGWQIRQAPVGPGLGLQQQWGDRAQIVATLICGDNYFQDHIATARAEVLNALKHYQPDVVVAGPAFHAGRYGLACGEVCKLAVEHGIAAVTAMHPENPAVSLYHRDVYILPTGDSAAQMRDVLPRLAAFAYRLACGATIGPAQAEGYIARGVRQVAWDQWTAAQRAVRMLTAKLSGETYQSEVPVEAFDRVPPAAPVDTLSRASLALVTTSGLVPMGNPDGLKSMNESRWRAYLIADKSALQAGAWEPVHGGYDTRFARDNPHLVVPLDELRELEHEGVIGRLHPRLFVTVGVGTPVAVGKRIGEEIADELHRANVSAAILTSN